jgi:hypothetical protein
MKPGTSQGNRTTKLSLGIIKVKLKLRKVLLRVRNKLKNAEYFHIYLKTNISYQKLSDGTYIRALTIQDIVQQGFNKANVLDGAARFKKAQGLDRKYTLEVAKPKPDPKNRRHTYIYYRYFSENFIGWLPKLNSEILVNVKNIYFLLK